MGVGSIDFTTIVRSQDYSTIKQNEDNKVNVDQSNFGQQISKTVENKTKQVQNSEDLEWQNKKFDAKEKGSNTYSGNSEQKKKKQEKEQVVVKGHKGFDVKI